ncbi:transmembrane protein, putative [Medicago truncatula]|uniref:Transmembrane protein, putative n=1 Tax=Medicago truncatula TaxID=3880 RepID=G7JCZ8_MEDTR|nr:transmembrane protein, putative [Medicago truncatula]
MAYNPVLLLLFFFFMLFTCSCFDVSQTRTTTGKPTPEATTEKHPRIIGLGSLLYPKGENTSWPSQKVLF